MEQTETGVVGGGPGAPPVTSTASGVGVAELPALVAVEVARGPAAATTTAAATKAGGERRDVEIDGLRAVAVLGIVLYHAAFLLPVTWPHAYPLVLRFDVGVQLFFMISGYLIYGPFVRAHVGGRPTPRVRDYLVRRAVRIYPAYLVAVGGLSLLGWIHFADGAQVIQHLTLTQGYFPRAETSLMFPPGIGPAWTLVIEVSFYLFVPVWAWAVRSAGRGRGRDARRAELAGVGLLIAVGVVAAYHASYAPLPRPIGVLPPHLASLGWGMLLAVLTADGRFAARWRSRPARLPTTELCWVGAAMAAVTLSYFLDAFTKRPTELMALQAVHFLVAALVVTPVVVRAASMGLVTGLLRWRPMVAIGIVSYGIYLWHLDVMLQFPGGWAPEPYWPAVGGMTVKVVVAVVLGVASFRLVESPLMATAARRLRERRRRAPAPPAPPAPPIAPIPPVPPIGPVT